MLEWYAKLEGVWEIILKNMGSVHVVVFIWESTDIQSGRLTEILTQRTLQRRFCQEQNIPIASRLLLIHSTPMQTATPIVFVLCKKLLSIVVHGGEI